MSGQLTRQANDPNGKVAKATGKVGGHCPLCGEATVVAYRPFCSRDCRDRDLINWLDGVYAVLAAPEDDSEAEDESTSLLQPRKD